MTKTQQRQMLKGRCFNRLMKLYQPKTNWKSDQYSKDESFREQRDSSAQYIIEQYLKKLEILNKS
mgnify:FL=1